MGRTSGWGSLQLCQSFNFMHFARYDRLTNVEENYEEIINGNFNTQKLALISLKRSPKNVIIASAVITSF